jgi:tRNA threonylcarbamoyladenosine biosynthesis protein TsaE
MSTQVLKLMSEGEQETLGARVARACEGQTLIFLEGDLGAGKTTLARGFLRGLGHWGTVKSPTYTLIEPYEIEGRKVYHLDLYRVADPGELEYLGLREMLSENATLLIEWAERGEGWLPPPDLRVLIRHCGQGREVELDAFTPVGEKVVSRLGSNL